jgi:hypothetical protein
VSARVVHPSPDGRGQRCRRPGRCRGRPGERRRFPRADAGGRLRAEQLESFRGRGPDLRVPSTAPRRSAGAGRRVVVVAVPGRGGSRCGSGRAWAIQSRPQGGVGLADVIRAARCRFGHRPAQHRRDTQGVGRRTAARVVTARPDACRSAGARSPRRWSHYVAIAAASWTFARPWRPAPTCEP